jgi:hypothetical protein
MVQGGNAACKASDGLATQTRGRTPEIVVDYFHQSSVYSQQSDGRSVQKGVGEATAKLQDKERDTNIDA